MQPITIFYFLLFLYLIGRVAAFIDARKKGKLNTNWIIKELLYLAGVVVVWIYLINKEKNK